MTDSLQGRSAQVTRLRVRGLRLDPTLARLRLTGQLAAANWQAGGLAPSAILCVRALRDPLPGALRLESGALRPPPAWEQAMAAELGRLARQAARPSQGPVPANAEAVLFADEGEMLACLALDMVQGEALERWWWRAILRSLPSPSAAGLTTLLCERSASVPAALHHLAERGQAVRVVEALSPAQALAVLAAVGRAYGLPDLHAELVHPSRPAAEGAPGVTGSSSETKEPGDVAGVRWRDSASMPQVTAPWDPGLVPPGLKKERACLLGVGLSLYHRPAAVRSTAFRRALADWWTEAAASPVRQRAGPATDHPTPFPERKGLGTIDEEAAEGLAEPANESGHRPAWQAVEAERAEPRQPERQGQADGRPQAAATGPDREARTSAMEEAALHLEDGIHTRLGGVLYLINLMAHLDLPACFEADWSLDSQVGAWGVLELLGRGLLAGDWEPSSRDDNPLDKDLLWMALAQLDGRELGELPGAAFRGDDCFRLPMDWVRGISGDEGVYHWASWRQRLRLWSEKGYVLLDGPRDGSLPKAQAAEELQRCLGSDGSARLSRAAFDRAPAVDLTGPLVAGLNPHLARWLALVLPYIRFRLRQALNPASAETWDLGKALLLHPGWLYVTSTHVDLVMSLESISLPVRLAGLDCNPGWMPDFARVVLFHFE